MNLPQFLQPFPRMWDIVTDANSGQPLLRIGEQYIALSEILEIEHTELVERDYKGLLAMGVAFMVVATIFLILVAEFGWRERFILGAVVTATLGMMSLYESATSTRIGFVELRIFTRSGEELFTTADHGDAAALELAITGQRA
jgi:hypothetical protein